MAPGNLVANFSDTAPISFTINQMRQAFALQRLYERDARGGTRYTEILNTRPTITTSTNSITNWNCIRYINRYINSSKLSINFFSLIRCIFTFKNVRNSTNKSLSIKRRIFLISRLPLKQKNLAIHMKWN